MKLTSVILMIFLALATTATSANQDLRGISFKPGQPVIGEDLETSLYDQFSHTALHETIKILKTYPDLNISITGHADFLECFESDCQALSTRRAMLVRKFFIDGGVSAERIICTKGYGNLRPIVKESSLLNDFQRSQNRAIQIHIEK